MPENGLLRKLINLLPIAAILTFVGLYFTLSYYNRWASDDFSYSGIINMHGSVWKATVFFYYNWSSGFVANLFYFIVNYLTSLSKYVGWYNISILLFFNLSVYLLLKEFIVFKSGYIYGITSALISAVFFFSSLNIQENWFWVIGSNAYQVPVSLLNFAVYFLLRYYNNNRQINFCLACFFVFIFSQFYVHYACTLFFLLLLYMAYYWWVYKKLDTGIVFLLMLCIVGVVIFITAPGNYVRLHVVQMQKASAPVIYPIAVQIKIALQGYLNHIVKARLPYLIVFLIPAAMLISTNFVQFKNPRFKINIRTTAALIMVAIIASFIITGAIMYMAIKWMYGSERSYLLIMWLLVISVLIVLSWLLNKMKDNIKLLFMVQFIAVSAFAYYSLKTYYVQRPVVEKYAEAEDNRIQLIQKLAHDETKGVITLEPLPDSGLLMSAEISNDTAAYVNFDMKNCFALKCNIKI